MTISNIDRNGLVLAHDNVWVVPKSKAIELAHKNPDYIPRSYKAIVFVEGFRDQPDITSIALWNDILTPAEQLLFKWEDSETKILSKWALTFLGNNCPDYQFVFNESNHTGTFYFTSVSKARHFRKQVAIRLQKFPPAFRKKDIDKS